MKLLISLVLLLTISAPLFASTEFDRIKQKLENNKYYSNNGHVMAQLATAQAIEDLAEAVKSQKEKNKVTWY